MDILGASVWLRWLESNDVIVPFPSGGYRGEYIRDIAGEIDTASLKPPTLDAVLEGLPADAPDGDADSVHRRDSSKGKSIAGRRRIRSHPSAGTRVDSGGH